MPVFTNQTELRQQVIDNVSQFMPELEEWRETWGKISDDKKIEWLVDGRSSFLSAAAGVFIYLLPFFQSLVDEVEIGRIYLDTDTMKLGRTDE